MFVIFNFCYMLLSVSCFGLQLFKQLLSFEMTASVPTWAKTSIAKNSYGCELGFVVVSECLECTLNVVEA